MDNYPLFSLTKTEIYSLNLLSTRKFSPLEILTTIYFFTKN